MIKKIWSLLFRRKNYKFVFGIVLGMLLSMTGVYASLKYTSSNVYYNNKNSSLSSKDIQGAIDELSEKVKKDSNNSCPRGYNCLKKKNILSLGDYVYMRPVKSFYKTDTSKTGYTKSQIINPQELNLWRVIKINDDKTVEMISEYVSSTEIYFEGKTGYQNLVGYLNVLAKQYENSTYTKGARYFGYDGQTEYISDTSKFLDKAPWESSTSNNTVENQGGGDILYQNDYNLVNTVLKNSEATKPEDKNKSNYWIASRSYNYFSSIHYQWSGRYINSFGQVSSDSLYFKKENLQKGSSSYSLRPILILKSEIKCDGVGTKEFPMKLYK